MASVEQLMLYMVFAAILGIVYSLRMIFLLEKRIASMELGIEKILEKIEKEEFKIERTLETKKKR